MRRVAGPSSLGDILRVAASVAAALFSFASMGLLAAVAVGAAVVWTYSRDLPSYAQLSSYEPPTISRIFSTEGDLIDEFAKERRLFSPIEEIPAVVKQAVISAEDKNFYTHKGYDPVGMLKAAVDAARGGRLRGASTITQQVMKNFLLGSDRTIDRKIKEIVLAAKIERQFSKDEILELYLNEIFLGQNSYGVAAAAQTYFNKPLEELSVGEAAYLAALPKAPSSYHPVRQTDRAIARRNFVLQEMVENGYLDPSTAQKEAASGLRTVLSGDMASFKSGLPPRGYFTDEIRRQLSGSFGEDSFFSGGLTIRATVDPGLQRTAATALRSGLEAYDRAAGVWHGTGQSLDPAALQDEQGLREALAAADLPRDVDRWHVAAVLGFDGGDALVAVEGRPRSDADRIAAGDVSWVRRLEGGERFSGGADSVDDVLDEGDLVLVSQAKDAGGEDAAGWSLRQLPEVQGAFMAMDVNSGRVLAMQGGFSYQQSVFNRTTQAARQPGSAFKPFVYAAALDSGYTPATILIDAPIEIETPEGIWRPANSSDVFYGPVPLRTGIEFSRNLMTIRLAKDVGMENVADYAENFGIYGRMDPFLANSLGAQETTLFKMVAGYAMFANGGERVEPTLVDRVQDRWGNTIYRHDKRVCSDCDNPFLETNGIPLILSNRTRVIDAVTAYQVTSMMEGAVKRGTGRHTVKLGVPVAGKTGTTNESKDAWFVGYTPNIVAGCFIGFDQPRSMGKRTYGGTLCGPVFNEFMKVAIERYGSEEFKVPDGGVFVSIDRETGEILQGSHTDRSVAEFFRLGTEPDEDTFRIVDGGFAMASDLAPAVPKPEDGAPVPEAQTLPEIPVGDIDPDSGVSSFGSLSSGGLY